METRDKLFTEEQYRKQLAGYSKRCKQLESSIMEIINAEKEHIQLYSAIFNYTLLQILKLLTIKQLRFLDVN